MECCGKPLQLHLFYKHDLKSSLWCINHLTKQLKNTQDSGTKPRFQCFRVKSWTSTQISGFVFLLPHYPCDTTSDLPSDGGFDAQTLQATCHLRDVEAATIVFVHGFEKTATIGDAHPPETKLAKKWRRRSEKWHLQIYITLNISPRVCASSWASHGKPEFILFDWVSFPSTFRTFSYQHPAFNFRCSDSDLICC